MQISHFKAAGKRNWCQAGRALELIEQARAAGLDVTADMYPYLAGSTMLVAMLPEWAHEGGKDAILQRLAKAKVRQAMMASMQSEGFFQDAEWDKVLICDSPQRPVYQGHDIASLAAAADKSALEWVFDALRETDLNMTMAIFMMSEENRRRELGHPAMMIGTDGMGYAASGPMSQGRPHPRSYGTVPRILGHYVREQTVISLEEAVWKMSGFPAQKLGLKDRGRLVRGAKADVVVFDPRTVIDRATYVKPHQYPAGIPHVIVNGKLAVHNGLHTGEISGSVLRR
ncbi:MAG: amidohydrolase family protein [Desulfobacterales bacterium]|nr:MAG: amidohydrolase family protein [Desulfobacterales bacterium]